MLTTNLAFSEIANSPVARTIETWRPAGDPMISAIDHIAESRGRKSLRFGAVSYLNSKPLIEGFSVALPQASLLLDVPSRLADELQRGRLDIALIPSVEAFSDPDYVIVSDACVATHGPVMSVKLYCRVHPGNIRTLALDEGSRTSACLTKVILGEQYGVQPHIETLTLKQGTEATTADAILLIGDRAMHPPRERFHTVWDLGEKWLEWTGLPFVFAMWVARRDTELRGVSEALNAARDLGLKRISEISQRECGPLGLSPEVAAHYLANNLHFRLGAAERQGLRQFHQHAAEQGLVPSGSRLRFYSEPSAMAYLPKCETVTR